MASSFSTGMVSIPNFGVGKLFSELGRFLESSGRKVSTANEAYATDLCIRTVGSLYYLINCNKIKFPTA